MKTVTRTPVTWHRLYQQWPLSLGTSPDAYSRSHTILVTTKASRTCDWSRSEFALRLRETEPYRDAKWVGRICSSVDKKSGNTRVDVTSIDEIRPARASSG